MIKLFVLTCTLLVTVLYAYAQYSKPLQKRPVVDVIRMPSREEAGSNFSSIIDSRQSCTIIYAANGQTALGGNNKDYKIPSALFGFCRLKTENSGESTLGGKARVVSFPREA